MHPEMKRKLVANMIPALVPLAQVGVHHHFDKKMLDKRHTHELEMTERRAQAMAVATGNDSGLSTPRISPRPRSPRVYDALEDLRAQTHCGFCQHAIDELMNADRDTAADGLHELQEYHGYLEDARSEGHPPEKIEENVEQIASSWEVVPRVVSGV